MACGSARFVARPVCTMNSLADADLVDTWKITGPYEVRVPLDTGFSWSVVSWSGANDVTCKVAIGDRVVIDNSGPNQMSATCQEFSGVQ